MKTNWSTEAEKVKECIADILTASDLDAVEYLGIGLNLVEASCHVLSVPQEKIDELNNKVFSILEASGVPHSASWKASTKGDENEKGKE